MPQFFQMQDIGAIVPELELPYSECSCSFSI